MIMVCKFLRCASQQIVNLQISLVSANPKSQKIFGLKITNPQIDTLAEGLQI
jgi:hypothetical protein